MTGPRHVRPTAIAGGRSLLGSANRQQCGKIPLASEISWPAGSIGWRYVAAGGSPRGRERSTNAGLPNEKAPPERGWCGRGSIMSRTNLCLSPYGYAGAGRNLLVFGSFSALKPSHSHPIPRGFASGISGGLGHLLALGGVFQKFVSWIDRCHRRSLLGFPVPMDTIEWRTKRATAS